jgi:hypothetical protein
MLKSILIGFFALLLIWIIRVIILVIIEIKKVITLNKNIGKQDNEKKL